MIARAALVLVVVAVTSSVGPSQPRPVAPAPFAVGERATYDVKFGFVKAGTATMELQGIESVRGRNAWKFKFRVTGGVPLYRVDDILES